MTGFAHLRSLCPYHRDLNPCFCVFYRCSWIYVMMVLQYVAVLPQNRDPSIFQVYPINLLTSLSGKDTIENGRIFSLANSITRDLRPSYKPGPLTTVGSNHVGHFQGTGIQFIGLDDFAYKIVTVP